MAKETKVKATENTTNTGKNRAQRIDEGYIDYKIWEAQIPVRYLKMIEEGKYEEGKIIDRIREYIKNLSESLKRYRNIYVYGIPGSGKSFSVSYLLYQVITRTPLRGRYINGIEIGYRLYTLESRWEQGNFIAKLVDIDLLVIDDIDKINYTDYKKELIYYLIEKREQKIKRTIYTANKGIKEISEVVGEYLARRIIGESMIVKSREEVIKR